LRRKSIFDVKKNDFAYLYRHGASSFTGLREALDVTEGNLSGHLGTMEDADCVAVEKEFVDRKPRTTYELTDAGREACKDHVGTLESLIETLDE